VCPRILTDVNDDLNLGDEQFIWSIYIWNY